jgi:hypothetical protein
MSTCKTSFKDPILPHTPACGCWETTCRDLGERMDDLRWHLLCGGSVITHCDVTSIICTSLTCKSTRFAMEGPCVRSFREGGPTSQYMYLPHTCSFSFDFGV